MKISEFVKLMVCYTANTVFVEHGTNDDEPTSTDDETISVEEFVNKYKDNDEIEVHYIFISKLTRDELCVVCDR